MTVDDYSGVASSAVESAPEIDETIGEPLLFLASGAIVHDLHRQWYDVGVQSCEVCQQLAVCPDHAQ